MFLVNYVEINSYFCFYLNKIGSPNDWLNLLHNYYEYNTFYKIVLELSILELPILEQTFLEQTFLEQTFLEQTFIEQTCF